MPSKDEYIAEARRLGEFLGNANANSPGGSDSLSYATSVLANIALSELPEIEPDLTEAVEDAVAAAQEAEALEAAQEPVEKPKKAPAKKNSTRARK